MRTLPIEYVTKYPDAFTDDDYGPGLDGIDTAHIIGAAILGAGIALAGLAAFIHHAFITPSRQPRRTR